MNLETNQWQARYIKWYMKKLNLSKQGLLNYVKKHSIKLLNFLVMVNLFRIANDAIGDFNKLRAYQYGIIYTGVHRDFVSKSDEDFVDYVLNASDAQNPKTYEILEKAFYYVSTCKNFDFMEQMHEFDFWKNKFGRADMSIRKNDISDADKLKLKKIYNQIPDNTADLEYIFINDYHFVWDKKDSEWVKQNYAELIEMSRKYDLTNPVFVKAKKCSKSPKN
ncbi:hypothetical protein E1I18_00135 [Mycoplasmopsis mucosicanis]|uniref:Uncharacterized protein n=1 Tax=Mycoplasmopsis mucosicanis TaxID=458208 RepID=A0A507SY61_9BACT|nr:hypothetical protein [Mycoplasmopsis mucosicanis]TQC54173.1 hypothetical protein E1I18_00135 [Mycoplasmopsis mucosicanis]